MKLVPSTLDRRQFALGSLAVAAAAALPQLAHAAWPVYVDLMQPHFAALSVKDFKWNGRKSQHVSLGTGQVDPQFFKMIRRSNFDGPISLHVEYLPQGDAAENLAALKADFVTLRGWLEA